MTTSTAIIAGLVSIIIATVGGWITARVARRANEGQHEVALSAEARQWVTQAQADAKEAKNDAAAARDESERAWKRANQAERTMRAASDEFDRRMRERDAQLDSVMRWVERVVRTAQDHPEDLVRIVNGGPPEFTAGRLPRPNGT